MSNYRLRAEGELLVLQVYEYPESDSYGYGYEKKGAWRDAKLTDIPVYDLFQPPRPDGPSYPVYAGGVEG